MDYTWDPEKSRTNTQKHGYSFDQIRGFDWEFAICVQHQAVLGEERELWIGPIVNNLVTVVVVETYDTDIRIISLRSATNTEIAIWRREFQSE